MSWLSRSASWLSEKHRPQLLRSYYAGEFMGHAVVEYQAEIGQVRTVAAHAKLALQQPLEPCIVCLSSEQPRANDAKRSI